MRRRWRLLLDGSAPGPWNMGVDEALLATAAREGLPTLRFYAWRGPWLSLGYAQRQDPAQLAAAAGAAVGVVRRTTGGRAVLHGADLTYAVAAPAPLLPDGLRASYGLVAEALIAALRGLGVEARRSPATVDPAPPAAFDCFGTAGADELCAAGRKLCGSAQRRSGGAVLQHGSLRLAPDPPEVRRRLGLAPDGATSLHELGAACAPEAVRRSCVDAFARALEAALEPGALSPAERRQAALRGVGPTPRPTRIVEPTVPQERPPPADR